MLEFRLPHERAQKESEINSLEFHGPILKETQIGVCSAPAIWPVPVVGSGADKSGQRYEHIVCELAKSSSSVGPRPRGNSGAASQLRVLQTLDKH